MINTASKTNPSRFDNHVQENGHEMHSAEDANSDPSAVSDQQQQQQSNNETVIAGLFNAVRYGLKNQSKAILDANPAIVNTLDSTGHTLVHFAAKRGDVEMLQLLSEFGAKLGVPAASEAKMSPVHWAASEGKVGALRFFLDMRQDMNAQDSNGCTPVIVAAQHNQANSVAFLAKNGADLTLRDSSGDTALHWAAYSGQLEVLGLLSYCRPQDINAEDNFGQTPLHLAALKGHTAAVEYLLLDCGADAFKKDRNGLTAAEVAQKKGQLGAEWAIRRHQSSNTWQLLRGLSLKRLQSKRILSMAIFGANDKEMSNWPWRVVFLSNLFASVSSVSFALNPLLLDLYPLHVFNFLVQVCWWICFTMCLFKSPSLVRDEAGRHVENGSGRKDLCTYEGVLESLAKGNGEDLQLAVCHSCHVCKPLRSKHCKILRRCVNKFDHYCPFVGNAVGRDNYKFFVGLLTVHVLCAGGWEVAVGFLWSRDSISWGLLLYAFYAFGWLIMVCFLLHYHILLIVQNLTTNEHINMGKYAYMRNQYNMTDNPFDLGSAASNCLDGLFPLSRQLYSRNEALELRNGRLDYRKPVSGQPCSHHHCQSCEASTPLMTTEPPV